MCVLNVAEYGGTPIRRKAVPDIFYKHRRVTRSCFATKLIVAVVATLTGWLWEAKNRRGKAKADQRYVSSQFETFASRTWSLCWCASRNQLTFSTQEIEDVALSRPDWTIAFRHGQEKSYRFCSAMQGNVWEESNLLARYRSLSQVHFIITKCYRQAKLQDLELQWPETVYKSPPSLDINSLVRYLQNRGNRVIPFWLRYSSWRQVQRHATVLSFF